MTAVPPARGQRGRIGEVADAVGDDERGGAHGFAVDLGQVAPPLGLGRPEGHGRPVVDEAVVGHLVAAEQDAGESLRVLAGGLDRRGR